MNRCAVGFAALYPPYEWGNFPPHIGRVERSETRHDAQ
jgi:hypothetical protein